MRIAVITTDNRVPFKQFDLDTPHFGTAPEGLLEGFRLLDGIEVHVISCSPIPIKSPVRLGNNVWFHLAITGKWGAGKSLFIGCVRQVRKLLREIQPDIVHGQGTERDCSMDAVFSGFPNVLTIHGNMRVHAKRPEHAGLLYYKIVAMLETLCLRRTSGVVAISTYTEDLVRNDAKRIWLLPNAVDARFYNVEPIPPAVPRILIVGTLNERKNPVGFVEACADLLREGRVTLAFAGNECSGDPYYDRLAALAKDLPGIELLGFLGRDELAAEMGGSTLLALPTFEDNCPMVVLEAMAAGIPVVASRVGGVPDLVNHEVDGLLFDPSSPRDVNQCVRRMLDDPAMRAKMGAAGRTKAQNEYHPKVIAGRHLEIYREVIAGKRP